MSREAIEEAIEVLEDASADMLMETGDKSYYVEAIAVLRQALETEKQEPVAHITGFHNGHCVIKPIDPALVLPVGMALYRAPTEWVGLTDDDYEELLRTRDWGVCLIEAVEAKLKEKNGG
jgi:hypothetical protein